MRPRIAIIGSGPTGIYILRHLLASPQPLDITVLEAQAEAGWGMPYSPVLNSPSMLANIASIEIPPPAETLVAWLGRQTDGELARLGILREQIDARAFYPRVVVGEFFRSQFLALVERARAAGHSVTVLTSHQVTDLELRENDILVTVTLEDAEPLRLAVDHAVVATGHTLSDVTEVRPGWFASPYPTSSLRRIPASSLGILGTSLSAIDAAVTVAQAHGVFLRDPAGLLQYRAKLDTEALRITLMSRKGLLPEADFYFPIPYEANAVCTPEAVDALVASKRPDLLDATFELFREELRRADPDYAARIGLAALDADGFAEVYFAEREAHDPFAWAARNLAEAQANYARQIVVPWRYAILRMHETIERVVPNLSAEDLARFDRGWKSVFVDDYATVPHESIERLLALRRAGRLDLLSLGADYRLEPAEGTGARLIREDEAIHFSAFIEATGQKALDAQDLPFPTLRAQGAVREARTAASGRRLASLEVETGGVEVDDAYRPIHDLPLCRELYLLALPFLLHQHPFHQGLTSAEELGRTAAQAILATAQRDRDNDLLLPGLAAT